MPIYRKGQKEDLENYRSVSLTSVLGKVIEQTILSAIIQHVQGKHEIGLSQHGFMKGTFCLTNFVFFDQMTCLVDLIYLVFNKEFYTAFHDILTVELTAYGLDRFTFSWVKKLAGCPRPECGDEWS